MLSKEMQVGATTVIMDSASLETLYKIFDEMDISCGEFCPTEEQIAMLAKRVGTEDSKFIFTFLLWVQDQGKETPENKKDRAALTRYISNVLVIPPESQ